jgi:hypothetical protein
MRRIGNVVALVLVFAGCASPERPLVDAQARKSDFHSAIAGRPFLARPVHVSVEGATPEFGSAATEELWLNAIQGGVSGSDYRYFMFRVPSLAEVGDVDVVFFNDDAKGMFVPFEVVLAEAGRLEFAVNRKSGGGESYTTKSMLRFTVVSNAGETQPSISVSVDCGSQLSTLFIPAGKRHWRARMEFVEARIPEGTLDAARLKALPIRK